MGNFGVQDMVSPLSRVIVHAAAVTMAEAEPGLWHYADGLIRNSLDSQHRDFIHRLEASGTLSLNVLALKPRHGIMVDGFPLTKAVMENAGCTIDTFNGDSLCIKCEGGPTCLTRPLHRNQVHASVCNG